MQTAEVQTEAELLRLAHRRYQAMVDWLGEFEWHFWATLTCKYAVSERRLRHAIEKFERGIRRRGQGPNPYFAYSIEGMPSNPHVHMLLCCRGPRRLGVEDIKKSWRLGYADVCRYDPTLGASGYMFKAMRENASFELWGFSSQFPHTRSRPPLLPARPPSLSRADRGAAAYVRGGKWDDAKLDDCNFSADLPLIGS
ncbi:MAG: hypothetical protein ACJ796_01915 [Gemmatimonadaceae bacterium]